MTEKEIDFEKRSGVEALVEHFGGLRPCAARLELAVGTVQGWKKRGSVPAAHQPKIRALLQEQPTGTEETTSDDKSATNMEKAFGSAAPPAEKKEENQEGNQEEKKQAQKKEKDASVAKPDAAEEAATEEGIVSAFTSGDDFTGGSDEGLDISSEVWEHAALPRSTSGQWAILISLIALVGVLTRPLWAEPIDTKLMGVFADGGHGAQQSSESHASESEGEGVRGLSDKDGGTGTDAASSEESSDASAGEILSTLPRDLLTRLEGLERDMAGVSAQQSAPAAAELRRLKSESDALAAAFDNQSARLDSLSELLQRRTEALSRLRTQVELLEQNRATERLSRRLNALFQLENIAYAIAQRSVFSLERLESSLSVKERERLEGALALLRQANNLSSKQQLLSNYRRLLPDLLVWQATSKEGQSATDRGFVARLAQKLRAQMFGIFSLRRRYGDEDTALLQVERMLADGRFERAEEILLQASPSGTQAREQMGEEIAVQLEAFRAALSSRNSVFAALHEIRAVLSSRETNEATPRQPSS